MKICICISHEQVNPNSIIKQKIYDKLATVDWSVKFECFFKKYNIPYDTVYIDRLDWIKNIKQYDLIIWKPKFMGNESSQFFKEKVYFIQHILKKIIIPNYETVWHFDSKIAQSYIFDHINAKVVKTYTSFDYNESIRIANNLDYPIVVKKSNGAGSTGVSLCKSKKKLIRKIDNHFIFNKFKNHILNTKHDNFGYFYAQKFLKNNLKDLRITVIGDKYAFWFWRTNRNNDFRASGSGLIDYNTPVDKSIIEYCAKINKDNNFDSMAYDILFDEKGNFYIIEMSYGYSDIAVRNSNGYFYISEDGTVNDFIKGHYWPQELWVKWLISKVDKKKEFNVKWK
ncbi:hypothetical protein HF295_02685 [Hujiaoplasma nucleasis]|uniref:ATP-grasp domain-containing protein n=1 Tax=Hujiaoplasma nucleasis TaxID=2725268 RepID=A0A7L6N2Y8_9MOLU|nr:hypothetical protein [Hujiaoplasma nucleasis]QLY39822.1 hypothetical protein HF295_02685 [Hujiaoplasma nucleasis]